MSRPTARPEDVGEEIYSKERYVWLEILVPDKYPEETASFILVNPSLPGQFKRY